MLSLPLERFKLPARLLQLFPQLLLYLVLARSVGRELSAPPPDPDEERHSTSRRYGLESDGYLRLRKHGE